MALTAVIQHHVSGADPGMVGLAIRKGNSRVRGCRVVGGVALTAVIQHHVSGADPGMVGLAIR